MTDFLEPRFNVGGEIFGDDPADWFGLASDGSSIRLRLIGISADYDLFVYTQDPELIGSSERTGNRSGTLTIDVPAGDYLIAVIPKADAGPGQYRLKAQQQAARLRWLLTS